MSTALITTAEQQKLRGWLKEHEAESKDLGDSLGGWMDQDAFVGQIMTALADPKLNECTIQSHYAAARKVAAMQLDPSPLAKHVSFRPRNAKIKITNEHGKEIEVWVKQVEVAPEWRGYKAVMMRVADVVDISHEIVFAHEQFKYDKISDQIVVHEVDPFDDHRGQVMTPEYAGVKGGYLTVQFADGRRKHHFITTAEVFKRREKAETRKIWDTWPKEMFIKTIYRDAYARGIVNIDPLVERERVGLVMQADDRAMGNDPMRGPSPVTQIDAEMGRLQYLQQQLAQNAAANASLPGPVATPADESQEEKPKRTRKPRSKKKEDTKPEEKAESSGLFDGPKPPDVPESLAQFASAIHLAKDGEEIKQIFKQSESEFVDADEFEAASELCDWKIAQLNK